MDSISRLLRHFYLMFLLITTATLYAQRDVRLSKEPLNMVLPDHAKIQSAAQLDGVTLAVWGTSYLGSDSSVVNTLVMQIVHDSLKVGDQKRVTSSSSRPFGFVQVLTLAKHFMVVWNDNRNGDTVAYLQRIDPSGNLIGSEEVFSPKGITPFGIVQIYTSTGYKWFWSTSITSDTTDTTISTIYYRTLDAGGNFDGQAIGPLDGSLHQASLLNQLSGITLLHRGTLPPLLVDSTGNLIPLQGEAKRHFTLPYYLSDDGSIITLENKSIQFYRTLLDTISYKVLPVPFPKELLEGSQSITRDALQQINVIWAQGGPGYLYGGGLDNCAYTYIMRIALTPLDTFSQPSLAAKIYIVKAMNHLISVWVNYGGTRHIRGCDNRYRTELTFYGKEAMYIDSDSTHVVDYTRIVPFIVTGDGSVISNVRDLRYEGDAPMYQPPIPALAQDCDNVSNVRPERLLSKTVSAIRLNTGTHAIELSAPAAARYVNVPQRTPGIIVREQQILIGWQTSGLDTLYELGAWRPLFQDSVTMFPALEFNQIPEHSQSIEMHRGIDTLITGINYSLLHSIHSWNERVNDSLIPHRQYNLYIPTPAGWRHGFTTNVTSNEKDLAYRQFQSYSFDSDNEQLVGVREQLVAPGRLGLWAFAVDENSNQLWTIDSMLVLSVTTEESFRPASLIALGDKKSLSIYNGVAHQYNGVSVDSSFILPAGQNPNGLWPAYARILGPYILRWHTNDHLLLDILRFDGTIVAAQTNLLFPQGSVGYHITQNPSDSGFAILFGGKEGSIALLDKHLNILQTNIPLSSAGKDIRKPVAVFRNDTLFAVWEDYRNGVPDIYGSALSLHTSLSAPSPSFSANRNWIDAITPNPVNEFTTITLSKTDVGTLTIVDSYGEIRSRVEIDNHQAVIDTHALPTGVYYLLLSGKEAIPSTKLIVVH